MIPYKRIYDPASPEDGLRLLCTIHWPRGIRKDQVDRWYKELGTPEDLLRPWLDQALTWEEFHDKLATALEANPAARAALDEVAALVAKGTKVTLLASIRDLSRTHLPVVIERIEARLDQAR